MQSQAAMHLLIVSQASCILHLLLCLLDQASRTLAGDYHPAGDMSLQSLSHVKLLNTFFKTLSATMLII